MTLYTTITAGDVRTVATVMSISVNYEVNKGVTEVLSAYMHEVIAGKSDGNCIDVKDMLVHLDLLDGIVDDINWHEIAADTVANNKELVHESYLD